MIAIVSQDLPVNWRLARLDSLGTWQGGSTPSTSEPRYWVAGTVPWVSPKDMKTDRIFDTQDHVAKEALAETSLRLIPAGAVLVVTRSGILEHTLPVAVNTVPVTVNQDLKAFIPLDDVAFKWVYYALKHSSNVILRSCSKAGTTVASIDLKQLLAHKIPVPPLHEQQRIVEIIEEQFSRLDAADAALRRGLGNVKRLGASLFDQAAKEAEKHGTLSLGEVAEVISGPAFTSKDFSERGDGVRLLRGENIEPGSLRWINTKTWPEALLVGYEHLFVSKGDIILAMDRPIVSAGLKLARVTEADLPALLVQRVARIRPIRDIDSAFLFLVLKQSAFVRHVLAGQTGTQLPHITLAGIRSFRIPALSLSQQETFAAEVERSAAALSSTVAGIASSYRRSAYLRHSVLQAAFNGKFIYKCAF